MGEAEEFGPLGVSASERSALLQGLQEVRERMGAAARRAGRSPEKLRLVAVTKAVPVAIAAALVEAGVEDLGENRPEGLAPKVAALAAAGLGPRWHMIGHYQRRKIRDTLRLFDRVHSLHSESLAKALDTHAEERAAPLPVLLQINISGEESKQGLSAEDAPALLEHLHSHCPHLSVDGLMTMAPAGAPAETLRAHFEELRKLRDRLERDFGALPELSMGMSDDFEVAIEEGATQVRVGSALYRHLS